MTLLLLSIAWVLTVAGLLTRAITQYRHYQIIGASEKRGTAACPTVAVIVPARNEERIIARCLGGVATQDYPSNKLQLIAIDDSSTDRTGVILSELAASRDGMRVLQGEPLPPGWLGKPHACWQAQAVTESEWLCFIDADTIAEPPLIRTGVDTATQRGLDLLSLQPFQELKSAGERLILPAGFFLIAFTQDLRRTNDPGSPDASVNGQFLLIKRSAYLAVGGHAAVRDAIAEDSALARAIKSAGYRIGVFGTEGLLHTRMYGDFRSLWEGTARQAATLLHGMPALVGVAIGALLLASAPLALPAWAAVHLARSGGGVAVAALILAATGSLALFGTHVGAARYFKIPFWYGLLFPAGYLAGAGVLAFAAWQGSRGQTRWKGRLYPASTSAPPVPVGGTPRKAAST